MFRIKSSTCDLVLGRHNSHLVSEFCSSSRPFKIFLNFSDTVEVDPKIFKEKEYVSEVEMKIHKIFMRLYFYIKFIYYFADSLRPGLVFNVETCEIVYST